MDGRGLIKFMAKTETKEIKMPPVAREAIAEVRSQADFVEFLRRELDWPIPLNVEKLSDVAIPHNIQQDFGFDAAEDRIHVSRLLNLTEAQPWGVFLFEFKTKKPHLSHLRRLLRALGSQRTLRKGDPIWNRNDLLFICTHDWKEFQFVHFSGEKAENAVISSFGWKGPEDPFLHTLCKHNLPRLRMPAPLKDGGYEPDGWRSAWRDAFNLKPVTDEFYAKLKEIFNAIQTGVKGLKGEDRRFFSILVLNRLIFLKFIEKKGWLGGDANYLWNTFKAHGTKHYWRDFLFHFFFEGLNAEPKDRPAKVRELLGDVPFLNAELFALSNKWNDEAVNIDNDVFDLLFEKLLNPFNFTVCETSPLDIEVAFNQDLLGYGYEELIADQHGQGAYYTHPTEVNLMCRESLRAYLESKCPDVDKEAIGKVVYGELLHGVPDSKLSQAHALKLYHALHDVTVVDPALGSGTFPVAMMKHLFYDLRTLGNYLKDSKELEKVLAEDKITDPEDAYALKLHIIERSLYGCDIDYFAVQIAKLRFWIELMVDCQKPVSLPNFNYKLLVGDALVAVVGSDRKGNPIALENAIGHPTKEISMLGQGQLEEMAQLKTEYYSVRDSKKRQKIEDRMGKVKEDLLCQLGVDVPSDHRTDKHILWQIDFAEILSGSNPGFDIAIGNPPYLRQELVDAAFKDFNLLLTKKILCEAYCKVTGEDISSQSDLYLYFFYRAFQLLKQDAGILCFICSNSWLDVAYGESLRSFVHNSCEIPLLLDSAVARSFSTASVNTTIDVFKLSTNNTNAIARFISLSTPMSTLANSNKLRALMRMDSTYSGVEAKGLVVSMDSIAIKEKWGACYLKAPSIFHDVMATLKKLTTPLGKISSIRRGITSGCNEFFYLNKEMVSEFGVEQRYLKPVCRGPRDIDGYVINNNFNYKIFLCHEPLSALKGTRAFDYIKFGEKQGYHKRATVSVRDNWYDIKEPVKAQLCVNHRVHRAMKCFLNNGGAFIGDNFHEIFNLPPDVVPAVFLSINSSFIQLWVQVMGRVNFGDGLLECKGYELENLPILEMQKIDKKALNNLFAKMIEKDDAQFVQEKCDEFFCRTVGISPEILGEVKKAMGELIEARLSKAGASSGE